MKEVIFSLSIQHEHSLTLATAKYSTCFHANIASFC